jgi:hypothetical protein
MLNQTGLDPTSRAQQYGQPVNAGFNAPYTLGTFSSFEVFRPLDLKNCLIPEGNLSSALQANGMQTQLGVR